MATGREKAPKRGPMTLHRAIKLAQKRSHLSTLGMQYVLHTWSSQDNAWQTDPPRDHASAVSALRQTRIRLALLLLEVRDAEQIAYHASHDPGRWSDVVKAALEADRAVRETVDVSKAEARAWGRS